MDSVHVRVAAADDLPAIRELIPLSVRGLSGGYYSAEQIESAIQHVFGPDTQLIADGTYFVAERGGVLAGCGGWSRRRTLYGGDQAKAAEDPLLDPAAEPARIRAFFVHPEHARRGVASAIYDACVSAARAARLPLAGAHGHASRRAALPRLRLPPRRAGGIHPPRRRPHPLRPHGARHLIRQRTLHAETQRRRERKRDLHLFSPRLRVSA